MDIYDPDKRSEIMSRVRGKDTKVELCVRKFLHTNGLRYRLHDKKLPGRPDLSFPSRRLALFVHGCFWHGHEGCIRSKLPTTRLAFWKEKIEKNKARDERCQAELALLGWQIRVLWQCAINEDTLKALAEDIRGLPRASSRRTVHYSE
jgi:DNA mismatch endonuclease (patch repair protein)